MIPFTFHPKVVVRTPRLPFDANLSFEKIDSLLYDNTFLESVYLASPVLYKECLKYRNGEKIDEKSRSKIRRSLSKYYLRSTSRCTPFGLFSGCAVSEWIRNDRITMQAKTERHTRFDMHYLCALAQELAKREYIQKNLFFYTNNSFYMLGDEIRYVEYKYLFGRRVHQISAVATSDYIEQILEEGQRGITIDRIKEIISLPEVDDDEIEGFIQEILEAQLLVGELEPAITGEEFIHQILRVLKRINHVKKEEEIQKIISILESANQKLIEIDSRQYNESTAYGEIMALLNGLGVPFEESKLFQTDLVKRVSAGGISLSIQENILKALNIMNGFSSSLFKQSPNLENFGKRFYKRYEDREVPLLEVLDTESGIGYIEASGEENIPLVQDIVLPSTRSGSVNYRWSQVEEFVQQKLVQHFKSGETVIKLNDEELSFMERDWSNLPPSMHVLFRLIGKENDKIFIESCGSSSAVNLLSRFAHADKEVGAMCHDIVRSEEALNPDVIFAEIVHLPESRTGNVLLHPAFRKYEIPYLSKSSLPATGQISVQDLLVSVKNGEIILRSKKLGKRIIPRLSNAHNYTSNALPVYQFLCELQTSRLKGRIGFSWGSISQQHKILPRVEYENVVLSPATWKLSKNDFSGLLLEGNGKDELASFLSKYNIPQKAVLADGDNELFVNFGNDDSIEIFRETIRKRSSIELKEFFDIGDAIQDEGLRTFNNQVLAVLLNKQQVYKARHTIPASVKNQVKGSFSFGSEWLYYKIYCGAKSADRILTDAIKPAVNELIEAGHIKKFFFIRYNDPDFHLRVRLKLSEVDNIGVVATKVHQRLSPLFKSGHAWNIQLDTYNQELDRYGSSTIDLTEEVFFYDSVSVLEMLSLTWGDERDNIRWLWVMRAIDELLTVFTNSVEAKLKIMEALKDSFAREFQMNRFLKEQLNAKYRVSRKSIEQILNQLISEQVHLEIIKPLLTKTEKIKQIADQLKEMEKEKELEVPIFNLLSSYIHMLVNRAITSKPRQHELIIYDFLYRHYKSLISRQEQKTKKEVVYGNA